jgi:hypothetical protein
MLSRSLARQMAASAAAVASEIAIGKNSSYLAAYC